MPVLESSLSFCLQIIDNLLVLSRNTNYSVIYCFFIQFTVLSRGHAKYITACSNYEMRITFGKYGRTKSVLAVKIVGLHHNL